MPDPLPPSIAVPAAVPRSRSLRGRLRWPEDGVQPLPLPGCAMAAKATLRSVWPGAPTPLCSDSPREVIERFVDLLYRRRQVRAAFESCVVARGYRDHGLAGRCSRARAMTLLAPKLGSAQMQVQLLHLAVSGDTGMLHLRACAPGAAAPQSRVEVFRVADGRIVEHWSLAGHEPG